MYDEITEILLTYPKDYTDENGNLFWMPPLREPIAIEFDSLNSSHIDFILAASNIHAYNFRVNKVFTKQDILKYLEKINNSNVKSYLHYNVYNSLADC